MCAKADFIRKDVQYEVESEGSVFLVENDGHRQ
jgi:hypothetical protein